MVGEPAEWRKQPGVLEMGRSHLSMAAAVGGETLQ